MTTDDRRARGRHTAERRQNAVRRMTVPGCALGLAAVMILLFLLWLLV